jgi:hypothetical protein
MRENNYHCTELKCGYRTNVKTPKDADKQLVKDGGCDINKKSLCPKCKKDSLVFINA